MQSKWVPAYHGDYVSIAYTGSAATIAYNDFVTASDGNPMVSYQQFQTFLPLVVRAG